MPARAKLIGMTFGRLGVVEYAHSTRHVYWRCVCVCGAEVVVDTGSLTTGHTKSCGCFRKEVTSARVFKHGQSNFRNGTSLSKGTPAYQCWKNMLKRCYYRNCDSYKNYGGRGIRVCERWHRFENFLADMGAAPEGMELDRRDNDGDYKPENCRWASIREQVNNRRITRWLTHMGETKSLADWARERGIKPYQLRQRLDGQGWSLDEALRRPMLQRKPPTKR